MPPISSLEQKILDELLERRPDLKPCIEPLLALHDKLAHCFDNGGTLFTCGNGGSNADALHIVGEMNKSFERKRPLPAELKGRFQELPFGEALAENLEVGLSSHALGFNGALKSAVENDNPIRDIAFAQELNALVKPGDVLLALSTSGNADNCLMAMSTAKAHDAEAISITGPGGGKMAELADLAIKAPGGSTKVIQEGHIALWHTMCLLIESHYFREMRV
jgi:D-sedoheptulose 7-phosphate isomerase